MYFCLVYNFYLCTWPKKVINCFWYSRVNLYMGTSLIIETINRFWPYSFLSVKVNGVDAPCDWFELECGSERSRDAKMVNQLRLPGEFVSEWSKRETKRKRDQLSRIRTLITDQYPVGFFTRANLALLPGNIVSIHRVAPSIRGQSTSASWKQRLTDPI